MIALMENDTAPPSGDEVSANVRAELARLRRTGRDVARLIGLSESAWRKRLAGTVAWRAHEVAAIARVLGVPVARLYGGDQ